MLETNIKLIVNTTNIRSYNITLKEFVEPTKKLAFFVVCNKIYITFADVINDLKRCYILEKGFLI